MSVFVFSFCFSYHIHFLKKLLLPSLSINLRHYQRSFAFGMHDTYGCKLFNSVHSLAETHIYFYMDDWYSPIPTQPHFHKLKYVYIHLNSEYIFRELNSRGKYDICMLCGACQGLNWNASEDHTLDYLLYLPHLLVLRQPQRWKY